MKSIFINKIFALIFGISFFTPLLLSGQGLFNYPQNVHLNEKQQHFANAWINQITTGTYSIITINNYLFEENKITMLLPDSRTITIKKNQIADRNNNMQSWYGGDESLMYSASFVIHNSQVTGLIYAENSIYQIYPIGDGLHLIYKSKPENYPNDESEEGYKAMIKNGIESSLQSQIHFDQESNQFIEPNQSVFPDCKVRVFVGYTQQCADNLADVPAYIQSCIDATNLAYSNSQVSFQCELARSSLLNYNETYIADTDLVKFRNPSDGIMDNAPTLRNYYDADLCILIIDTMINSLCGLASMVGISSYNNAYCVVARGCAIGNLSFPHELGHLYGCRHDTYVDNTNTPYAYGHGYVYTTGFWRTIMAYNDRCSDFGFNCTRLQYFSNPAVNYNGQAMGTVATNDNESALETSVSAVAALEPYINSKSIPYEVVWENEDGDLMGATSVENSDVYLLLPNANMQWRAGSYIDLKTDFWALEGCTFSANIESCTSLKLEENNPEIMQLKSSASGVQVYPNPFTESTQLYFNLNKPSVVNVYLTGILGEQLNSVIHNVVYDKGAYKIIVDAKHLAAGIYFLVIERGNEKSIKKIIKVN